MNEAFYHELHICIVHKWNNRRDTSLLKGRELAPDKKTAITYGGGVSCLILDDVTADNAGKYEVSVDNRFGRDRRVFSVAVEGTLRKALQEEYPNRLIVLRTT